MTERARRIFLWAGLILGFVGPFVVGAVVKPLASPVGRHFAAHDRAKDTSRDLDDQTVWDGFPTSAGPVDRNGTRFLLDFDRALADAKLANRPVFAYFTTVNDANARRFDINVLRTPAVIARLRHFVCAALFVDSVPYAEKAIADRLRARNEELQLELFDDIASPVLAILHPHFDDPATSERRIPLAIAFFYELKDEAAAAEFLDRALEKWSQTDRP